MSSEYSINGFMIACGMTGPLELEVEDRRDGSVERRVYHQPYVLIGRMPAADLPLDHEQVSRRHAYIQVVSGRAYCFDLASRSGMHWDATTYGSGWLDRGRSLKLGPFVIRLSDGVPSSAGSMEDSPDESGGAREPVTTRPRRLPRVALEFLDHPEGLPPWQVTRRLSLVGRSPMCQLLLSGAEVSRFHAALIRSPMGIWVVDLLGGRKGVSVNGRLVRSGLLSDGDEIEVGAHRVLVRYRGRGSGKSSPALPHEAGPPALGSSLANAATVWPGLPSPGGLPFPMPTLPATGGWSAEGAASEVRAMLAGRPPEQVELAESLLIPVVHQFGQMHMQMFDQFQQVLVMLFQMFSSMHREQMDLVRDELGQIRRLTADIQTTQKQLQEQQEALAEQKKPPANGTARRSHPSSAGPSDAVATSAESRRQEVPEPRGEPGVKEGEAARQLHTVLTQRIASLQKERETRWQKLVRMMSGGS